MSSNPNGNLALQGADQTNADFSDEWLMQAYIEGNDSCLAILVHRYERELYSYLRRLLGDGGLAEDVFQNTFMQLHVKRHMYQQGRPLRPWLYTIATNQAIDALRQFRRHQRVCLSTDHDESARRGDGSVLQALPTAGEGPTREAERREHQRLVRAVVDALEEPLRVVLVLCYYQGMKYKEVAEIVGIPVGTVKSRLHTAIQRLGDRWKALGISADP